MTFQIVWKRSIPIYEKCLKILQRFYSNVNSVLNDNTNIDRNDMETYSILKGQLIWHK